jgi:hypothetical protein
MLPNPPHITEHDLQKCRDAGDYCPILFEWYKFVGGLAVTLSCLQRESPALRSVSEQEYAVLVGLIHRCSRLMLSNVALSHEGKFGETTAIIDRCIFESCVIISWLCRTNNPEHFVRYIANGLKTELELKQQVEENILARGGNTLAIEKRMLESIERCISESGVSENLISSIRKLPDLASMIRDLGRPRYEYTVGQRIGSHHVHGTWVSLITHYLEKDESGVLRPQGHPCETHVNQYVYIPAVVLDALSAFVEYTFLDCEDKVVFIRLLEDTSAEIFKINDEVIGNDFSIV